ncbi:hypothetical protein P7K49_035875 [Saguinus oedipus]|uniref:Uncharacterized protein n=1 Tax=Saguinus oedipus TaxID=9490 RepID=A0ABQ9TNV1_SAGOE|nr:hypothetical protein P7K49_035875 [Saguinus oedipus]
MSNPAAQAVSKCKCLVHRSSVHTPGVQSLPRTGTCAEDPDRKPPRTLPVTYRVPPEGIQGGSEDQLWPVISKALTLAFNDILLKLRLAVLQETRKGMGRRAVEKSRLAQFQKAFEESPNSL